MQQFACKAAELEELVAAFTQHRKQYRASLRAATARPPRWRNIGPRAWNQPLYDTGNRGEILTLVQRSGDRRQVAESAISARHEALLSRQSALLVERQQARVAASRGRVDRQR